MVPGEQNLFPTLNTARYGDQRRTRPLFIPNLLLRESHDKRLDGKDQENAYQIILKWADMESSGRLDPRKETSLESEFLTEVFGQALGYTLFSEDKEHWNLEPKFSVNSGQADAAIGLFQSGKKTTPRAVIELKGPTVNVDRDRFNGRTAVRQCWDYLNDLPECPWGIVCNFVSFRLYHRNYTPRAYELFTLQDLRNKETFLQFYYIFQKKGLIPESPGQMPRADSLLEKSATRQRQVGDELYDYYRNNRVTLIQHLLGQPHNKSLDEAIRIAQKLIDRIIFVAFCKDRELLPKNSISDAWSKEPPFHRVTNPKWRNFFELFRSVEQGNERRGIPPYDGGLFKKEPEVDDLDLSDDWTDFFKNIGEYDFQYEIDVDVLGRLFEKSIKDIEKLRQTGLFESRADERPLPKMVKSAERKKEGIYYTPPEFTQFIVFHTVGKLADGRIAPIAAQYGIDPEDPHSAPRDNIAKYVSESVHTLRQIKVVDSACGSGAFLIQAYQVLEDKYIDLAAALGLVDEKQADKLKDSISDYILYDNLFGVDLSPAAVEIAQLSLWLRSAKRGKTLADLSKNIICGNSLIAPDFLDTIGTRSEDTNVIPGARADVIPSAEPNVIPSADLNVIPSAVEESDKTRPCEEACPERSRIGGNLDDLLQKINPLDWQKTFPDVFSRQNPGFDAVIGNPPWERFTLKNREFFDTSAPHVLEAPTAAESRRLIAKLAAESPPLYERYVNAKDAAEKTMTYIRRCGRFPLAGKGDINTYAVFAELARTIVSPTGRVGLLVPTGIATDKTNEKFFAEIVNSQTLFGLYDFENRSKIFPDVDARYKFSILLFAGPQNKSKSAKFIFFAQSMADLKDRKCHIPLSAADFKLLNPNTRTCPVFRSKRDAAITKAIYRRVPVLIDNARRAGGNPWGIKFLRMFDQSNDAELFHTADQLKADGSKRDGAIWKERKQKFIPLYEAKMIQMYDHRAASVVVDESNWMRQGQTDQTPLVQHQNPEFTVEPRWWVNEVEVHRVVSDRDITKIIAFKNVTSPTNQRTMIAAFIPYAGVVHSSPLIFTNSDVKARLAACLLANLNALAYDYICRQKIGGVNLSYFIIEQMPTFSPDFYAQKSPWSKKQTLEKWISDRVLKLTCTSNDMIPLGKAAGFDPPVHKWNPSERLDLMAQLDAAYFLLYGIDRNDVEYILSTFAGLRKERQGAFAGASAFDRILRRYDDLKAESK